MPQSYSESQLPHRVRHKGPTARSHGRVPGRPVHVHRSCNKGSWRHSDRCGGVTDHIHLLVDVSREASLAQTARDIKSLSSGWIHRTRDDHKDFAWQPNYGAFSVGYSQVAVIKRYLHDQVPHHLNTSFKEEYIRVLGDHGIRYLEDYLWD